MFIKYNPNPKGDRVGDCTVRAISKLLEQDWDRVYIDLCVQGYAMKDMPSSNSVWGEYLINRGSYDGYSNHNEEEIKQKMRMLMSETQDPNVKQRLQQWLDEMEHKR